MGDKKAQEIVDYREQNGAFTTADDLASVKGIGEATVKKKMREFFNPQIFHIFPRVLKKVKYTSDTSILPVFMYPFLRIEYLREL